MEKYFELQYMLTIIGLIILGAVALFVIVFFLKNAIIYFYKSHSKKYEYDPEFDEYVRKKNQHDKH